MATHKNTIPAQTTDPSTDTQATEQTTNTPANPSTETVKTPEQTTPASTEAQTIEGKIETVQATKANTTTASTTPATPTAQTTPANPTKGQEPEQSAPNIQPPTPGNSAAAALQDYLRGGYYKGEGTGRYIDPDLVDGGAKQLAKDLAAGGLKQSALNPILRDLKRANKKTLPMEAKQGALAGAIPQAKQLVQRHRAPGLLVEVLEYNRSAIQESADYIAAVKHLTAVCVFLGDYQK